MVAIVNHIKKKHFSGVGMGATHKIPREHSLTFEALSKGCFTV
jgi:hypothetical protein